MSQVLVWEDKTRPDRDIVTRFDRLIHTDTMHHAFLISEVFSCIIGYFAEDTVRHPTSFYARDTRKDGRRALTALAGTCRALSGPALDALWRRLHSLRPLMLCLPAKASYDDATVDGALVWQSCLDMCTVQC